MLIDTNRTTLNTMLPLWNAGGMEQAEGLPCKVCVLFIQPPSLSSSYVLNTMPA